MDDLNDAGASGGEGGAGGAGDTGNEGHGGGQGQSIPYERFQQVYRPYQQYRQLGEYSDVQRRLKEHEQIMSEIENFRRSQSQRQRQTGEKPDDIDAIRARLLEVYPELEQLGEIGNMRQAAMAAYADKASGYLTNKLRESGIKMSAEEQDDFEDLLMAKMNQEQFQRFSGGDLSVVDDMLKAVHGKGIYNRFKPLPPKPPMRVTPGGKVTPGGEPPKPKTWDDAGNAAWEALERAKSQG